MNYRLSKIIQKIIKVLLIAIVACIVFGFITMYLWNWLMPAIFGLPSIHFAQALGLVILSKLLFGGFHRHGGGGGRGWKRHMQQRWEHMTPEERERFRSGMRGRRGWCDPRSPSTDPTSAPTSGPTSL
jgi:hypothetical protein